MTAIAQSYSMTQRHVHALLRQPWFVAMTITGPIIWLVLFGTLFKNITEIPGFSAGLSYVDYLMPGVLIMTALFSSGWSGMGLLDDLDRSILDRFLVTPVHRSSLIVGRIISEAVTLIIEALVIGAIAWLMGARFESGLLGFGVLVACGILITFAFASLSNAVALTVRQRESVIGLSQFLVLPLSFLSAAFMPLALVPDWIAFLARFNPVNWAVEAGREALTATPDWNFVLLRMAGLLLVAVVCATLATRAFRSYQRSA